MTRRPQRLLGLSLDDCPILEARAGHSMLTAATGSAKTIAGTMSWLLSTVSDHTLSVILNDPKDGECAIQAAELCARHGRRVAIIDDADVLGDNPYKVRVNALGSVVTAFEATDGELVFATETANQTFVEEPPNNAKDAYWREEPRTILEFAEFSFLRRNPTLATPGSIWSLIADPALLIRVAEIEAEEGDETLSALAMHILDMHKNNPEHFAQHRGAALKSLRIYAAGSKLHTAGFDADTTHYDLIRGNYIVFLVNPQRHLDRMGVHVALHLQGFVDALYRGAGEAHLIIDEATSTPVRPLVSKITTLRSYGGRVHWIFQSRSEAQRKFGEKETATIEENAVIKQWFGGMTSIEEAERISRAIGEAHTITPGLGTNSGQIDYSGNLGMGKDRLLSPDELMRLPSDQQIMHIRNVGWVRARKIAQNQIMPYAAELAPNPLEGGRLPPDPKLTLDTTPWRGA